MREYVLNGSVVYRIGCLEMRMLYIYIYIYIYIYNITY